MKGDESWFRAILIVSTAIMIGISWPLWVEGGLFPRVPFIGGMRRPDLLWSWVRLIALLATMAAGILDRRWLAASLVLLGWMILEDQSRLQPWAYQFLLMSLALVACPSAQAMGLCRLFLIALYFHSGLSKLNGSFVREMGSTFMVMAARHLGLHLQVLSTSTRDLLTLAMPAWEILAAIGLVDRRTRTWAMAGAIVQHLALLVLLGPWGMDHSANVLIWNMAMIPEVFLLFRRRKAAEVGASSGGYPPAASATRVVFILAAILPFGEPFGFWDSWPSFSLYSSRTAQLFYRVYDADYGAYPEALKRHFFTGRIDHWLELNDWSLAERRVPVYPQARTLNGIAEGLASRYGGPNSPTVYLRAPAGRRNGLIRRVELIGVDSIRRHGDSYRLNAHPVP